MDFITKAKAIRAHLDTLIAQMTDEQALQTSVLFREWNGNGVTYKVGERIVYDDVLYKVLQEHVSQTDWVPDTSPSLFAKILIPDDNAIPEWVKPDSTNGYMTGDRVVFNQKTYVSLIDNNIWSPADYPAGWQEIN